MEPDAVYGAYWVRDISVNHASFSDAAYLV